MDSAVEIQTKRETANAAGVPLRPAWIEIDTGKLRRNFQLIQGGKASNVQLLSVVKDNAYGHGAMEVANIALKSGATFLAVSMTGEAIALRERGIRAPILLFGERHESELAACVEHHLTCCVHESRTIEELVRLASRAGIKIPVHLKLNTGMNRYGARWDEAIALAEKICANDTLELEGVFSHFSMSDETDKSFANLQLKRFNETLSAMAARSIRPKYRHICNSGGFLDLPQAHLDMVRVGLLQFGVYPSQVCRRISGIEPAMTVKARIAAIQRLEKDDFVGYGLRYQAQSSRRIGVIPAGYGDGFPRIRNQGCVLVAGKRAPIVGGVAMDAFMVDITDIPAANLWDEAVLMGRQGNEEISAHEIAQWKNSVSYDVLAGWRERLPRIYLETKNSE